MRSRLLTYGLRPAGAALALGTRLGRSASAAAVDAAGRSALATLDALLGWRYTDEAIQRVLTSPVAEQTVGNVLSGPLVDAIARDIARYAVLQRVLEGAELEQAVDGALESPEVERLVQSVVESRLVESVVDTVVERLPQSEEVWALVDEIARSPAVTEAIAQQSMGFAGQMAGEVRVSSQRADAGLERMARRLLRREPPGAADGNPG